MRLLPVLLIALFSVACASGPHPATTAAAKDLKCPQAEIKRTEIYPKKQKIEGCGKEEIYILGCAGYGMNEECEWTKQPPGGK